MMIIFIAFALMLRYIENWHINLPLEVGSFFIIFIIYSALLISWNISIQQRIMPKNIRFYLLAIDYLMIFWIFVLVMKYRVFNFLIIGEQVLWVGYYIPIFFLPLLGIFAAACLNKPEDWFPPKTLQIGLTIFFLALIVYIMRDYHQLIISCPDEACFERRRNFNAFRYTLISFWVFGTTLVNVLILFWKRPKTVRKKQMWLPFLILAVGALYASFYVEYHYRNVFFNFIDVTFLYCALAVLFWESCIQIGLIPENTEYHKFFNASTLAVQIYNLRGELEYISQTALPLSRDEFAQLWVQKRLYLDADTKLNISKLKGGYVVWQEDLREMNRLIEELNFTKTELQDSVDLLNEEIKTTAKGIQLEEKSRLYDLISRRVSLQLEKIKRNLESMNTASLEECRELLARINILGTFVKRRSNLILMAEGKEPITMGDLEQCFKESLTNLTPLWKDLESETNLPPEVVITYQQAVNSYDVFERIIEARLDGVGFIYISLSREEGGLRLNFQFENQADQVWEFDFAALQASSPQVAEALEFVQEEDMQQVILHLEEAKGGY